MLSPPTTNTSPNCTISPGLPLTFSTLITSSAATRYCLPPVLMTANMALSSVRYGASVYGAASCHLAALPCYPRLRDAQSARSAPLPLAGDQRLERQVGRATRRAYGGRPRNCQGNGPFGA